MKTEFNLSDEEVNLPHGNGDFIPTEKVKEFIRLLKEEIEKEFIGDDSRRSWKSFKVYRQTCRRKTNMNEKICKYCKREQNFCCCSYEDLLEPEKVVLVKESEYRRLKKLERRSKKREKKT